MKERKRHVGVRRRDAILVAWLRLAASVCAGVIILIVVFVTVEALPALRVVGIRRLVTDASWHPTAGQFHMMPMVVGTLAATLGSLLLSAPLGLGSAVFLRFHAPAGVAMVYRRVIELLAGVPSVVYGLWGLAVLVPQIARLSPLGQGQSLLAGILVLTMMTLPTVALSADAALGAVAAEVVRGAAALGLGRRAIAWSIAVPAARAGILTGILLQTGRALGETMAVLMICGNIVKTPGSLFDPVRTLTANIALEMGYADEGHRSVLYVSGLVLLAMVAALVWTVEGAIRPVRRPASCERLEPPAPGRRDFWK